MSGYENAPATGLLATHCAACGRALVDAVSVEAGMGPDCREKYGAPFAGLANFSAAEALAGELPHDAREAANVLVHRIATGHAKTGAYIAAIDALGFKVLAAKLGDRMHAVRVEETVPGVLTVHAPFSFEFNAAIRRVPGQRWNDAEKVRTVPTSSRAALWAALKNAFPAGTTVFGSKGAAVL